MFDAGGYVGQKLVWRGRFKVGCPKCDSMAHDGRPVVSGSSSTRRKWLKAVGSAGAIGLAGCSGNDNSGDGSGGSDQNDNSGNGGTAGSGGNEITVLTAESDPRSQKVFSEAAKKFKQNTGNTVNFEYVSFEGFSERLSSMIRGGNAPEIGAFSMALMGNLYEQDLLAPIGDVIDEVGNIPPNSILSVDGTDYTIPYAVKIHTQDIRKDLLKEAGHEFPEDPLDLSWDTYKQWVSGIDGLENQTKGVGVVSAQTTKGTHEGIQYLWSNGVNIWGGPTDDVKVTLDQGKNRERAIEALNYVKSLHNHSPPASSWGWADVQQAFGTGQIGSCMYSIGRILAAVKDNNPQWSESVVPFETPYKQHKESGAGTVAFYGSFSLINKGKNLGIARDFLTFFYQSKYYIDYLHTVPFHLTPPIPSVFKSDAYRSNEVISSRPDILDIQEKLLPRATSFLLTADNGGLNTAAGAAYNNGTLGALLARVNVNDMDPGQAIDTTAEELRQQL